MHERLATLSLVEQNLTDKGLLKRVFGFVQRATLFLVSPLVKLRIRTISPEW